MPGAWRAVRYTMTKRSTAGTHFAASAALCQRRVPDRSFDELQMRHHHRSTRLTEKEQKHLH